MNVNEILEVFKVKPYLVRMGKGSLSRRLHATKEDIVEAKKVYRNTNLVQSINQKKPNILILDIETAPMKGYVFSLWKDSVNLDKLLADWYIICWSAKWLFGREVLGDCLTSAEAKAQDDRRIVMSLAKLLNEADIVVGHNCLEKHTKILKSDLTWVEVGTLKVGDKLVGFEEEHLPNKPRQIKEAIVTENTLVKEKCLKVTLNDGTSIIATPEHKWLKLSEKGRDYKWCETQHLKVGQRIERFLNPWTQDTSYEAGWLSGFISGEGTLKGSNYRGSSGSVSSIDFCQRPTKVLDQALEYCNKLNIDIAPLQSKNGGLGKGDTLYTYTLGGKFKTLEYLGKLHINRLIDKIDWNKFGSLKSQNSETLSIVSIEDAGEQEICILGTSTNTYIAEGFAMHNCKKFDLLKINARMLIHRLPPVKPYQNIDTLEVAKRQFGFTSNKLDYLAKILGVDTKLDTDFQLWADCVDGKPEALKYMYKYNNWDVECLEAVYLRLRPWIHSNVNLGLYYECDEPVCPNCGSHNLTEEGFYYTSVNKYQVYRCECGAVSRARTSEVPKDVKEVLLNGNIS